MALVLPISAFVLNTLNVLLHGVTLYALLCLYPQSKHKVPRLYLINMSLSHLIVNGVEFCRILPHFLSLSTANRYQYSHNIEPFIDLVVSTGFKAIFYLIMLFFTADRLLHAILSLRYPVYWSIKKTKYLLLVSWAFGIIASIVVALAVVYADFQWQLTFFTYIYPSVDVLFMIITIFTYVCIVRAYYHSKQKTIWQSTPERRPSVKRHKSKIQVMEFRKQYVVAMHLIFLFFLFVVIPDLVRLLSLKTDSVSVTDHTLQQVYSITYGVLSIITVVVYVCLLDDLRRWLQLLSYFTVLSNVVKYCPPICLKVQRYSRENTPDLKRGTSKQDIVHSNNYQIQGRESPCVNGRPLSLPRVGFRNSLPVICESTFLFRESPPYERSSAQISLEGDNKNDRSKSLVLGEALLDSSSDTSSSECSILGTIDRALLNRRYMKSLRESII